MSVQVRPDPAAQRAKAPGRLLIFLGYAPGVGKTAAMVDAARGQAQGVVILTRPGAVREASSEPARAIPSLHLPYASASLEETDLDTILAHNPPLVLVDELAHHNSPGSRHPQRYQDVEEILAAGIDVFSTLNVGQLESLSDVVSEITGVPVADSVPDRLLETADEVQIVDRLPAEVIQHWQKGLASASELGDAAQRGLFRMGNLIALRELLLRKVADRLDDQRRAYMQTRAIPGPWPAQERILVCVSPSPLGERLVRSARRLADRLQAAWFAVYVETPAQHQL